MASTRRTNFPSEGLNMYTQVWNRGSRGLAAILGCLAMTLLIPACGTKSEPEVGGATEPDSATVTPMESIPAESDKPANPTGESQYDPQDNPQTAATEMPETPAESVEESIVTAVETTIRVATFNVSLFRDRAGQLVEDLESGNDDNAHRLAHVIQTVRPDVLLLNEFDYDQEHRAIDAFLEKYLQVGHDNAEPISYPHFYTNAVNTGVPSGIDLDNDGQSDGWNDCYGFGRYPGQYGMVVLSRFPIDESATRTFQKLLWKDMKDANLPIDPKSGQSFYSDEAMNAFRISSKSHWDVVIDVNGSPLHFIVSHPTPPVFDGPEDRNGKRNHDEIRLIADYISDDPHDYIVDDNGKSGGLAAGSHFVIAGDLNADPNDGASFKHAAKQLTDHPLVQSTPTPSSGGSAVQSGEGKNTEHTGDARHDTADFNNRRTGNLRADYVLPSKTLKVHDAKVFWPTPNEEAYRLVTVTDHRMVWIDVSLE